MKDSTKENVDNYSQMSNKELIKNIRNIAFEYTKISVENYRRRINKIFSEEELDEVRSIEFITTSTMLESVGLKGKDMENTMKEFIHKIDDPNR